MSYDIAFKVKVEGTNEWVEVGDCDANITWNVGEMIRVSTGLEWNNEADNGLVSEVIPHILHGLGELTTRPAKYKKYESPNGWGTVDGCARFFREILSAWFDLAEHRRELAEVAHFWIY